MQPCPQVPKVKELKATRANGIACYSGLSIGCTTFQPGPHDLWVRAIVKDDSGTAVYAQLYQYDDEGYREGHVFCGAMDEPIPIVLNARTIGVALLSGPCDGGVGIVTRGTAVFKLSNLP